MRCFVFFCRCALCVVGCMLLDDWLFVVCLMFVVWFWCLLVGVGWWLCDVCCVMCDVCV